MGDEVAGKQQVEAGEQDEARTCWLKSKPYMIKKAFFGLKYTARPHKHDILPGE